MNSESRRGAVPWPLRVDAPVAAAPARMIPKAERPNERMSHREEEGYVPPIRAKCEANRFLTEEQRRDEPALSLQGA